MKSTQWSKIVTGLILVLAPCFSLQGAVIYQSATMGPTNQGSGWTIDDTTFLGSRFYIAEPTQVTAIGGHLFAGYSGGIFGAIVSLSSSTDLPNGYPFSGSEVVAYKVFTPSYSSSDFRTSLTTPVTLNPGYYALVFGSGLYGATGGAAMPYSGQSDLGTPSYIFWDGWSYEMWFDTSALQARFVVEGTTTPTDYCAAWGGCDEYISRVTVGTIDNTSVCGNYQDFTPLSTTMARETGYPITVTNGNPWSEDRCGIWVDWNQDLDFTDAGEEISVSPTQGEGPYTATITPPVTATLGNTRMRIRIAYSIAPTPCGDNTYGEVEDYTINVTAATVTIQFSGYVKTNAELGIKGVAVSANPGGTSTTDSTGYYVLSLASPWTGTVTPAKTDWTFAPPNRTYTGITVNQTDQNFTGTTGYGGGNGTSQSPYLIRTAEQLNAIGICPSDWGKQFKMTANIDLAAYTGNSFNLLGGAFSQVSGGYDGQGFSGVFDGNGHTISNFSYSAPGIASIGLFRGVKGPGAEIKNLGLVNPNVTGGMLTGALAGAIINDVKVSNCRVDGGSISGADKVGGMSGYTQYGVTITDSHTNSTVSGGTEVGGFIGFHNDDGYTARCYSAGNVNGYEDVGGFVGLSRESLIEQCYAAGDVTASYRDIGGFAGCIADYTEINNCYARGDVTGYDNVGNFLGRNTSYTSDFIRCYATGHVTGTGGLWVHGMVGRYYPDCYILEYNFFDTQTSGTTDGCAAWGKTTTQMYQKNTYAAQGWNFETPLWTINEGADYPKLWWETFYYSNSYGGGTGRPGDPFLIYEANQMNAIGANQQDWDKNFKLMADINLSYYDGLAGRPVFNTIGLRTPTSTTSFTGVFNGNGHSISNFKYLTYKANGVGIFVALDGPQAEIKNLTIVTPQINLSSSGYHASLVARTEGGVIRNCHVIGGTISGGNYVGALVGDNWGEIYECSSSCSITGTDHTGGLTGRNQGSIYRSYATGNVTGTTLVGGLTGRNSNAFDSQGIINDCYASGSVSGNFAGGLVGQNWGGTILNCYSVGAVSGTTGVGGLIGETVLDGLCDYSFWNTQTSGQTASAGGTPKNTGQMKMSGTFLDAGWDFNFESDNGDNDIWTIDDGNDYPRLFWQSGTKYGGGTGEPNAPYLIYTAAQMNKIGLDTNDWKKHFKLMADIDLGAYTGEQFNVIGYGTALGGGLRFTGSFDGNWHTISNFRYNSTSNSDYIGIFGTMSGRVKNLGLINPQISHTTPTAYVGPLAGRFDGGRITGCWVQGGSIDGNDYVGGLAGYSSSAYMTNCWSTAQVSGANYVGGLFGDSYFGMGLVVNCYAQGIVTGKNYVGGLAGYATGLLEDCYSSGPVTGDSNVGGLAGGTDPNSLIASNLFWNTDTSGRATSAIGEGKTTAQMLAMSTFIDAGWDFAGELNNGPGDDWVMPPLGGPYPGFPVMWYQLAWPALPGFATGSGTEEDPYEISTELELRSIGDNPRLMDKYYTLTADLTLADTNFPIIGSMGYPFTGGFDGQGHTITNLRYKSFWENQAGMFGYVGPEFIVISSSQPRVEIKNIRLISPRIETTWSFGAGALVGMANGGTQIINCHADDVNISGYEYTGGLAGYITLGKIQRSSAKGYVSCSDWYSGGLVGYSLKTDIEDCYSNGQVSTGDATAGGLIGRTNSGGTVTRCYSSAVVSGPESIGGLVGGSATSCVFRASFCDATVNPGMQPIGSFIDGNVVALPTEQMYMQSTYTNAGWDFVDETINGPNDIWKINEGQDYPRFAWEQPPPLENITFEIDLDKLWMYQNLPGQTDANITAQINESTFNDPANNGDYAFYWEIELPDDVTVMPVTIAGGDIYDISWTFAAPNCNEPGGISDSGQTFKVRLKVVGSDSGNFGIAEREFAIGLLGDVDNNGKVDSDDRSMVNLFWKTGSAGPYTLKDCDMDCNGKVDSDDRSMVNLIWKKALPGIRNSVSIPCPLRQ